MSPPTDNASHMALILGRPRSINASDCTIRTPLDCEIPWDPTKVVPTPIGPFDPPTTFSAHLFHYSLAQKGHEMMSTGANKRHVKNYAIVQQLHKDVMSLLQQLPPTLQSKDPDTSWDSRYPHLSKYRHHITSHTESRQAGIECALDCLRSQQQLFESVDERHYRFYTLSFYTIDAAIFLSAAVLDHPPDCQLRLDRVDGALRQSIARLTLMQQSSDMAKSGLEILTACYQRFCKSLLTNRNFSHQDGAAFASLAQPRYHPTNGMDGFSQPIFFEKQQTYSQQVGAHNVSFMAPTMQPSSQSSGITMNADDFISSSSWLSQSEQVLLDPGAPLFDSDWSFLLG